MSTVVNTEVSSKESTLADILGAPKGDSAITQTGPNNLFANTAKKPVSITELEESKQEKAEKEAAAKVKAAAEAKKKDEEDAADKLKKEESELVAKKKAEEEGKGKGGPSAAAVLTATDEEEAKIKEEEEKKKGRPAIDKDALIKGIEERIAAGTFLELDGVNKPVSEYTISELWETIDLNMEHRAEQIKEEVPVAFFDSLPDEFKVAYTYFAQGGTDVSHILKVVTQKVELGNLDPKTEDGQEKIVRNYLSLTKWGTPEEIDEEVASLKDKSELEKKANQFKPKLDAAQEENINRNLKAQEAARKRAEAEAANYQESVVKTLEAGSLAGIKLDKKDKIEIYNSFVEPRYQSFTGRQINEFGYLIEQKQFGKEKDLEAVFLAYRILKDKEGTLSKLREQGGSQKAAEVVKKLKTEQDGKGASTHHQDINDDASRGTKKIARKGPNNIFK